MSRAGKFIPGGGGNKTRTGPIRAPGTTGPLTTPLPAGKGEKKVFTKASLVKTPVAKNQRLPIVLMSALVSCALLGAGWYIMKYLPMKRSLVEAQKAEIAYQTQIATDQANAAKSKADADAAAAAARVTLTVSSNPTGASVTVGDFRKTTPATFTDMIPGTLSILIHQNGYEDYKQDVTITADKPTDLGTIQLVPKAGSLALASPQQGVSYSITGSNSYTHDGTLPDKLDQLPVGDYVVTASQGDWKLTPITVSIHDHDNIQREIKFPYANATITSFPSGATVRQGNKILGQTPVTLSQIRPTDLHLSVDLPPYTLQRVDVHLPDFGNVTKQVALQPGKDFVAAAGIPMVWIPDGGYWVGKYLVRQSDLQTVTGSNPSTFRKPNRPVETISWDAATAFCDQLTQFERKAGRLPAGFHYGLPTEAQWEQFSADANMDTAAMSRTTTLASTQDVGASEPNKYGLYDTLGDVWEWCSDTFDDKGNHTLRGGSWLSSPDNFPGPETRNAGAPKYADRFTGFRVALLPSN